MSETTRIGHFGHFGHGSDSMNRAERRRNNRNTPRALRAFAAAYRCPDCLSDTTEPYHAGDRWHINVHHDETCPMYRRLKAKGLAT
jgi:hypothetical protein